MRPEMGNRMGNLDLCKEVVAMDGVEGEIGG